MRPLRSINLTYLERYAVDARRASVMKHFILKCVYFSFFVYLHFEQNYWLRRNRTKINHCLSS